MEETRIQEPRNIKKISLEKAERRKRLGRHMSRWNNNITTDLKGTEWEVVKSCGFNIETSGGRF
jgi:hypothetical protein